MRKCLYQLYTLKTKGEIRKTCIKKEKKLKVQAHDSSNHEDLDIFMTELIKSQSASKFQALLTVYETFLNDPLM